MRGGSLAIRLGDSASDDTCAGEDDLRYYAVGLRMFVSPVSQGLLWRRPTIVGETGDGRHYTAGEYARERAESGTAGLL